MTGKVRVEEEVWPEKGKCSHFRYGWADLRVMEHMREMSRRWWLEGQSLAVQTRRSSLSAWRCQGQEGVLLCTAAQAERAPYGKLIWKTWEPVKEIVPT